MRLTEKKTKKIKTKNKKQKKQNKTKQKKKQKTKTKNKNKNKTKQNRLSVAISTEVYFLAAFVCYRKMRARVVQCILYFPSSYICKA